MAYTPNTWADGAAGGTPITAAKLTAMETGIADAHTITSAATTTPRPALALVYGSTFPSVLRPAATNAAAWAWVCDGTADQAEINAAMTAIDGVGQGKVQLLGQRFNTTGPIEVRSECMLAGEGYGTEIRAASGWNEGMVTLFGQSLAAGSDPGTHLTTVTDLSLNGNGQTVHGFHYRADNGQIFTTGVPSNPDPSHTIQRVHVYSCGSATFAGHGMWMEGGNLRAGKYDTIRMLANRGCGVWVDGSVDSHYTNIEIGSSGSGGPAYSATATAPVGHGFFVSQGDNNMFLNNKAWFSRGAGFYNRGTRNGYTNCQAQDNYSAGFHDIYGKTSFVGCHADSNGQANGADGRLRAGFYLSAGSTSVVGCLSYDKAESSSTAWEQWYGFQVTSGLTQSRIVGCVTYGNGLANAVANASVNGTPGAGTTIDVAADTNGR